MIQEQQQQQQNMTEELTGDTLTEFLRLLNEEDFWRCNIRSKNNRLIFPLKKGRHGCRYNNLVQLSIQTPDTE